MRRLIVVLVVVLLAVPALALASHTDPKRQINAGDQRKATSILLKRSDFAAGWSKAPNEPDTDEHLNCPGYNPTEADLVLTGDAESTFTRPGGFPVVFSGANIYKTRANALASWTRGAKPALAPCFAKLMKKEVEASGAQVAIAQAGRVAFPRLAPRTIAFRIVLKVTVTQGGETNTVPFTVNLVGVGNGRGDATLMTMGFGAGVAPPDVRGFAKLLAQRLAAAKL